MKDQPKIQASIILWRQEKENPLLCMQYLCPLLSYTVLIHSSIEVYVTSHNLSNNRVKLT